MRQCYVVIIATPKQYLLDGLWFGEQKAKTGFIFIHGLSSSAFSHHEVLPVHDSAMALYFNNRGHDELTGIKKINEQNEKGYEYKPGGEAHEVFTDCADDIQGAVNFLTENGIKDIYLVGHSTGCQKSVYYLSRKSNQNFVKGVVLQLRMLETWLRMERAKS
jgi:pimeloyl-ACP methyl ester carboxylesterase